MFQFAAPSPFVVSLSNHEPAEFAILRQAQDERRLQSKTIILDPSLTSLLAHTLECRNPLRHQAHQKRVLAYPFLLQKILQLN